MVVNGRGVPGRAHGGTQGEHAATGALTTRVQQAQRRVCCMGTHRKDVDGAYRIAVHCAKDQNLSVTWGAHLAHFIVHAIHTVLVDKHHRLACIDIRVSCAVYLSAPLRPYWPCKPTSRRSRSRLHAPRGDRSPPRDRRSVTRPHMPTFAVSRTHDITWRLCTGLLGALTPQRFAGALFQAATIATERQKCEPPASKREL